jgi:glycosyltransferase involved in cell wall biosynthesis
MQKAVIIIPTYNEQDVIAQTILAVFKACESVAEYQVEILVFDSSSTDNTGSIVQGLQSQFPLIHLVTEPSKQG